MPPLPSPGVGKKGEWTGFDLGLGWLEIEEGGEGSVVISRAKLGFLGSLPRWRAHLACHLKWQKRWRVTVCDGKCVGVRTNVGNEGVPSVRMAKS